jgi:hypothetical protein
MATITRIDLSRMSFAPNSQRVAAIEAEIARQRDHLRSASDPLDRRVVELNLADLGSIPAAAKDNEAARVARAETLDAERTAKREEREQRERAELEGRLVREYIASAPGTTEAEAKAGLPDLLHRHRLAELDAHDAELATARLRVRF